MTTRPAGGWAADGRVAGYLGRVLTEGDRPVGTCFQVATGVLVTAWHVLDDIGAATQEACVPVDALAGGVASSARVARLDPVHDLAVLTTGTPLPALADAFTQTDRVALRTPVTVTGHVLVEDDHTYRFLDAPGEWAGGTTRDDAVPLGRMASTAVMRGMSGAPVVRDSDGAVAGVVSGRYNTTDGWLTGTVWVARTEDLAALLDGVADVTIMQEPLAGPVDLLLAVTGEGVQLTGPGIDVSATHGGVRAGLAEAVNEVRRARARAGLPVRTQAEAEARPCELSLARAGQLLGESFLPGPVAAELGKALEAAERAHQPVRLGLEIPPGLAGLPWEALPSPDGRAPLVLHSLVNLYRKADTAGARVLAGPLRIVVAIASPETGGGPLLDYERELRNVLAEVRAARQDADVRVVPFATPAAIREELGCGPVHVLHISGHGSPGTLDLENEDGTARPVTAQEFLEQAVPPGNMPPVITLSACYTDAVAADGAASFAAELARRGASAVIGTETSVTDIYATRLLARVYATLARARHPDVVAALAAARREVQTELETSPDKRDNLLAGLGEWAAVTVLAASGSVPILNPENTATTAVPSPPQIAGLAGRADWYFVGRRAEQRSWPADLISTPGLAGIVVHGIGGTGKTTLAAELTARIRDWEPGRILASLTGPLTLEGVLSQLTSVLRRELLVTGHGGAAIRALDVAARADLNWQDRWGILRERLLGQVPVLLVLDNFEDNLRPEDGTQYTVRDEVLAGLLAAWAAGPGKARLLVTSRHPFILPGGAEQFLSFRQLGALSRAETMKLAWSLPALDKLDEGQLDRVWRLVGGHPRSLEYLDALLTGSGTALYPDVTARLSQAVSRRLRGADKDRWLAARTGLDAALAETVALAADDVLLDDLITRLDQVPGATDLLLGVTVYREPVDANAVLFQADQPDPTAENIPDRQAAYQRIREILAAAGITADDSFDMASVPEHVQAQLAPHVAELNQAPVPPFRPLPDLAERIDACQAASLLTISQTGPRRQYFVHRWTATELAARPPGNGPGLERAHLRAAAYWQWRVRLWPQDRAADVHDMLEARHHMLAAGDTEEAGSLTASICRQLQTWGAWDQEASLIHDTLARLPANSHTQGSLVQQLGIVAQSRGEYDEAAPHHQRARDIFERISDQAGVASSHHNLGNIAYARGDYDEATRQYQCALDTFERLGEQTGVANAYHQLGRIAQDRSDYDKATRHYQRTLDIFEQLGDQLAIARTYHQLGALAAERGNNDEAARHCQRALDTFERLGIQDSVASTNNDLGVLAQTRGDYDEATRHYQRALDIFERLGNQGSIASTYHNLGSMAYLRRDYHEATRQYQHALDIFERLGNVHRIASTYFQLGRLAYDRGDYEEGARQYQRALDIFERLGGRADIANTCHQLGKLAHDRGDYEEAARQYQRALDINEQLGNQVGVANTYGQLGIHAGARGNYTEASHLYHRALDIFERLGDQVGMATTYSHLGSLETEQPDGSANAAIGWHVKALAIHLALGAPQAMFDLRHLAAHRRELDAEQFTSLLSQAAADTELTEVITSLLDQLDTSETGDA